MHLTRPGRASVQWLRCYLIQNAFYRGKMPLPPFIVNIAGSTYYGGRKKCEWLSLRGVSFTG